MAVVRTNTGHTAWCSAVPAGTDNLASKEASAYVVVLLGPPSSVKTSRCSVAEECPIRTVALPGLRDREVAATGSVAHSMLSIRWECSPARWAGKPPSDLDHDWSHSSWDERLTSGFDFGCFSVVRVHSDACGAGASCGLRPGWSWTAADLYPLD